jgi:hypothetical protein
MMKMPILALLLIIALPASAGAQSGLEQRIEDLEKRVKMLEEQLTSRTAPPPQVMPQSSLSAKFIEPASSGQRWIRFNEDGTFLLRTPAERFKGTWRKSGAEISIRVPAGFAETFRISRDTPWWIAAICPESRRGMNRRGGSL